MMVMVVVVVDPFSFGFKCRSFPPLLRPTTTATADPLPVVVSRRYLSICGKVISGRSSAAPYRSRNEQTSAKLGQSAGPELLTNTGAAIFPGGERTGGEGSLLDATVCERNEWRERSSYRCQAGHGERAQLPGSLSKIKPLATCKEPKVKDVDDHF